VRQLRAILKIEDLPVGFVWIKKSTQNQKESKVSVLSTCSEDSGTPRTLSSKQIELVDGRSEREREREREFLRGIRKIVRSLE
jgi:hypothetical protein